MQHTCKNCATTFSGKFCHNCGQKAAIHDLTFPHIIHEVFHAFTHADKSFLVLLKKILIQPGKVAYEYIVEGKRQRYYNPFTFFLLITAINAFVESSLLNLKEKIFHDNNEYGRLFNAYNKLMLLIIVPLIALAIFSLYHRKSKRKYSEYTVFAMMLLSLKITVDIILNVASLSLVYFFNGYQGLDQHLFYLIGIIVLISIGTYQFHKNLHDKSIVKAILSGILFCLIIALVDMFIVWAFLRDFNGLGVFSIYGFRISG